MTMALITYFKTTSRCPHCGRDETAWIHSHLGDSGATYQIGDCPGGDIHPLDFDDTSYVVRKPSLGESIHVLLGWTCGSCGLATFAEVVFADGCVRDIQSVELTPETLERLHYIAEDVQSMIETITATRIYDDHGVSPDWLATLRTALEAGRRWS